MRIDNKKKEESCYRIYQTIREDPSILETAISGKTGISRNTIGKYIPVMRKRQIFIGPWLQLKPSSTHPRYMYFTTFSSPDWVFKQLRGFPSILYYAHCLGDWNLLFVTEKRLDFSKLVDYSETVYCGRRGSAWDLPAQPITWNESLSELDIRLENLHQVDIPCTKLVAIPWTPDEWKLFWTFKDNTRLKVSPTLKKVGIRYETFSEWRWSLNLYTQTLTEYYPQGLPFFKRVFFLLETDQPEYVSSVFEHWPATVIMTQIENRLLLQLAFPGGKFPSKVMHLFDSLVTKGIVTSYKFASHFQHQENIYSVL